MSGIYILHPGGELFVESGRLFRKYCPRPLMESLLVDGKILASDGNDGLLRLTKNEDGSIRARKASKKETILALNHYAGELIKESGFVDCVVGRVEL